MIGCEFAAIFAELGSQVTVVELLDQLLPGEDKRTGRTLQQAFKRRGIESRAQGLRRGSGRSGPDGRDDSRSPRATSCRPTSCL